MKTTARIDHQPDVTEIVRLFYNTTQNVNNRDYTRDQIDDWSSCYDEIEKWKDRKKY